MQTPSTKTAKVCLASLSSLIEMFMGASLPGLTSLLNNAIWLAQFSKAHCHANSLFDSDRFERPSDGNLGGFNVSCSQQFINDPESHHGIGSLARI